MGILTGGKKNHLTEVSSLPDPSRHTDIEEERCDLHVVCPIYCAAFKKKKPFVSLSFGLLNYKTRESTTFSDLVQVPQYADAGSGMKAQGYNKEKCPGHPPREVKI